MPFEIHTKEGMNLGVAFPNPMGARKRARAAGKLSKTHEKNSKKYQKAKTNKKVKTNVKKIIDF